MRVSNTECTKLLHGSLERDPHIHLLTSTFLMVTSSLIAQRNMPLLPYWLACTTSPPSCVLWLCMPPMVTDFPFLYFPFLFCTSHSCPVLESYLECPHGAWPQHPDRYAPGWVSTSTAPPCCWSLNRRDAAGNPPRSSHCPS